MPLPSSFKPIYINAGGTTLIDSSSKKWEDKGFSSGTSVYSNFSPISGVDDASHQGLFQTERYNLAGGSDMTYTLKVPPGPYLVTLYFCEIYVGGPGSRKFDVNIQGTTVLSDFDIFAVAGGGFKAVSRTFQVSVAQGNDLVIKLISRVNNAKVLAIQVNSSAVSPTPPAPTVKSPSPTPKPPSPTPTLPLPSIKPPSPTPQPPPTQFEPFYINVGSLAGPFTDGSQTPSSWVERFLLWTEQLVEQWILHTFQSVNLNKMLKRT